MVLKILQTMMNQEIPNEIADMQAAYADHHWESIEKLAHKMKGGAVYCGTLRLKYACQYLERYKKAGHTVALDKLYHQLIQVSQQSIEAIKQCIQK